MGTAAGRPAALPLRRPNYSTHPSTLAGGEGSSAGCREIHPGIISFGCCCWLLARESNLNGSLFEAEEMEKAMADLDDIYARIPERLKSIYCTETEEYMKKKDEREEKEGDKKKKLCVMPPHRVQMILNYKCGPLVAHKAVDALVEEDKEKYKDMGTLMNVCNTFLRHHHDFMRSWQEKVRHELETKGYVTYEATDDDEEQQEAVVHQRFRGGGGGRRRQRPGVMKSSRGGAVRRLN